MLYSTSGRSNSSSPPSGVNTSTTAPSQSTHRRPASYHGTPRTRAPPSSPSPSPDKDDSHSNCSPGLDDWQTNPLYDYTSKTRDKQSAGGDTYRESEWKTNPLYNMYKEPETRSSPLRSHSSPSSTRTTPSPQRESSNGNHSNGVSTRASPSARYSTNPGTTSSATMQSAGNSCGFTNSNNDLGNSDLGNSNHGNSNNRTQGAAQSSTTTTAPSSERHETSSGRTYNSSKYRRPTLSPETYSSLGGTYVSRPKLRKRPTSATVSGAGCIPSSASDTTRKYSSTATSLDDSALPSHRKHTTPSATTRPASRVSSVTRPIGHVSSVTQPVGHVSSVTRPIGHVSSVTRPVGHVSSVTRPVGHVSSVTRPVGHVSSVTRPVGHVPVRSRTQVHTPAYTPSASAASKPRVRAHGNHSTSYLDLASSSSPSGRRGYSGARHTSSPRYHSTVHVTTTPVY